MNQSQTYNHYMRAAIKIYLGIRGDGAVSKQPSVVLDAIQAVLAGAQLAQ